MSKTNSTMMVFRSHTMHSQSPQLTLGRTVLMESADFDSLGVTFDAKMAFEKKLCSVSSAASQRFGVLRKSWRVFDNRLLLDGCFCGLVLLILEKPRCLTADTHLRLLDCVVSGVIYWFCLLLIWMSKKFIQPDVPSSWVNFRTEFNSSAVHIPKTYQFWYLP